MTSRSAVSERGRPKFFVTDRNSEVTEGSRLSTFFHPREHYARAARGPAGGGHRRISAAARRHRGANRGHPPGTKGVVSPPDASRGARRDPSGRRRTAGTRD